MSVGVASLAACGGAPKDDAARASAGDSAGKSAATAHSPSVGARRVLFVGTSLTAGLGLEPEDAFPALIGQKIDSAGLGFEVVNAGLSGETSAGALRRVDWLLREPAQVVVLETGANDGLRGLDIDSTRANLRGIVTKIRAALPTARILLVQMEAPPNLGGAYTAGFRAMYQEIAREEGLELIPFLLEGVAGETGLNQADGIHPNESGERIVAENVWRALRPVLETLDPAAQNR